MSQRVFSVFVLAASFCAAGSGAADMPAHRPPSPLDPVIVPILGAGTLSPSTAAPIKSIAATTDGSAVFVPSPDGLKLLKVEQATGRVLAALPMLTAITRVTASPDGKTLAVLSFGGSIVVLVKAGDLSRGATLVTSAGPSGAVFSEDSASLYLACALGNAVQAFDVASGNLSRAADLTGAPSDLVLVSGKLLVAMPEAGSLAVLDAATLAAGKSVILPPGSRVLASLPGAVLAASSTADVLSILDASTLDVVKTLSLTDPEAAVAFGTLALVSREGAKIETLEAERLSAEFGERRTLSVLAPGLSAIASDILGGSALSADRARLVRISAEALGDRSRTDALIPTRGVPGTPVLATGSYGTGPSAVFMRDEVFQARRPASHATDTSFDAEVPLETALGTVQLWVSRSSPEAVEARSFVVSSPVVFEAVGTVDAVNGFIAALEAARTNLDLGATARDHVQAALDAFRSAQALLAEGEFVPALGQFAGAFDSLERALAAGAVVGDLRAATAYAAQYAVFSKLSPIAALLGEKDKDVKEARRLFENARAQLQRGQWRAALDGFVAAGSAVELAALTARKLRAAQAVTILGRAVNDLDELRQLTHTRMMDHAHHETDTPFHRALNAIGPVGRLKGAAIGYLIKFRAWDALVRVREAVAELRAAGHDTEDLVELACAAMTRMVQATADAVEANVGPHDRAVARARKFLEVCATHQDSHDHDAALGSLESALVDPLASSTEAPHLHLFQATYTDTTECHPQVKVLPIEPLCVHPDKGTISPDPMRFQVVITTDVPEAFGPLNVSIKRAKSGKLVFRYETRNIVAPSVEDYEWDGKDQGGNLVVPSGQRTQEEFVVEAEFKCFTSLGSTPHSAADQTEFTIVTDKGLLVKPSDACKCASTPEETVTQQFRAYKCVESGGLEDVTEQCLWTLSNPQIGTIGAQTGLFTAGIGVHGKSRVIATLLSDESCRGEADLTVNPESGGIVEPSVDLCVNGQYDFDVGAGCDENGDCIKQNDQDYDWTVSDPSLGSITADGFFTALGEGMVTVTASGPGGTFTAQVNISHIDSLDVITAPAQACVNETGPFPFVVQAFCNSEPISGVAVSFSAAGPATVQPGVAVTDGAGLATTFVTPKHPGGVAVLMAQAGSISTSAYMMVHPVALEVVETPVSVCVGEDEEQDFTVRAVCNGKPEAGIVVVFTASAEVTMNPASAVTDADGLATTKVRAGGAPSGAVNGTVLTATVDGSAATANMTVVKITKLDKDVEELCVGEKGKWGVVTQPPGAAFLIAGHIEWTVFRGGGEVAQGGGMTFEYAPDQGGQYEVEARCGSGKASDSFVAIAIADGFPKADKMEACVGDKITFTAQTDPAGHEDHLQWVAFGGDPNMGNGGTFVTEFEEPGDYQVRVRCGDDGPFKAITVTIVEVEIIEYPPVLTGSGIVTAVVRPGGQVNWSIVGPATIEDLGGNMARVTAGQSAGLAIVRATDTKLGDCFDEVVIQVFPFIPPTVDLSIQGVSEAEEESPGGRAAVNRDDDNKNGIPDLFEEPVAGENDLVAVTVKITPASAAFQFMLSNVTVETPGSIAGVRFWKDPEKRESYSLGSGLEQGGVTFYVEGLDGGRCILRIEQLPEYDFSGNGPKDTVRINYVDLRMSGNQLLLPSEHIALNNQRPVFAGITNGSLFQGALGTAETATATVKGKVMDRIAPVPFVYVNGKKVAVTQTGTGSMPWFNTTVTGLGPFTGEFETTVELPPHTETFHVFAVNAVGEITSWFDRIDVLRDETGAITERRSSPGGPELQILDFARPFVISLQDPSLEGQSEVDVALDTGLGQRTVKLKRISEFTLVSPPLLAVPDSLATGLPPDVQAARIPVKFGKDLKATYTSGALKVDAKGYAAGLLLLGEADDGKKDSVMFQVYPTIEDDLGQNGQPRNLRNAIKLSAGVSGKAGKTLTARLSGFSAAWAATGQDDPSHFKTSQEVTLHRQSDDPQEPAYNHYLDTPPQGEGKPIMLITEPLAGAIPETVVLQAAGVRSRLNATVGATLEGGDPEEPGPVVWGDFTSEFVAGLHMISENAHNPLLPPGTPALSTPVGSPRPYVKLDEIKDFVKVSWDTVSFTISGEVTDPLADLVPDHHADIQQLRVFGASQFSSLWEDTLQVVPAVEPPSTFRPHAFRGKFSKSVTAKVGHGSNRIVVEALNAFLNPGWATIEIPVEFTPLDKFNDAHVRMVKKAYNRVQDHKWFEPEKISFESTIGAPVVHAGPPAREGEVSRFYLEAADFRITEDTLEQFKFSLEGQDGEEKFARKQFPQSRVGSYVDDKIKRKLEALADPTKILQVLADFADVDITAIWKSILALKAKYDRIKTIVSDYQTIGRKRAIGTQSEVTLKNAKFNGLPKGTVLQAHAATKDKPKEAYAHATIAGGVTVNDNGTGTFEVDIAKAATPRELVVVVQLPNGTPWEIGPIELVYLKTVVLALDGVGRASFDFAVAGSIPQPAPQAPDVTLEALGKSLLEILAAIQSQNQATLEQDFDRAAGFVKGFPAGGLGKVFGAAAKKESLETRNFMPTVTWTNWASVFTGKPPKDHGITGLAFFPRQDGLEPIWSAGGTHDGLDSDPNIWDTVDFVSMAAGGTLNKSEWLRPAAKTVYEQAQDFAPKMDIVSIMQMVHRGARHVGAPLAFGPLIGTAYLNMRETATDATVRDLASGTGAFMELTEETVPDVLTIYFPGPDTVGHGQGEIYPKRVLLEITDRIFTALVLNVLEYRGWDTATLFAATADHGMSEVNPYPHHIVALLDHDVDENGKKDPKKDDVQELLKNAPLNRTVFGTDRKDFKLSGFERTTAVYSPNGGTAHIYLKETGIEKWGENPSKVARNMAVAEAFLRAHYGERGTTDVKDFQVDMKGRFKAVLYKSEENFKSPYLQLVRTALGDYTEGTLDTLPAAWNIKTRLNDELSDRRSGDVILIMFDDDAPTDKRPLAWNADSALYKGWHGSPSEKDSKVPLVFAFPARGNLKFLQDSINDVRTPGGFKNADLTNILLKVFDRTRMKQF